MAEEYKPLTDVVSKLVEQENFAKELDEEFATIKADAEKKLKAGLPTDEADKQKAFLTAIDEARDIIAFIPKFYGKE